MKGVAVVLVCLLLRILVSTQPHSGEGIPPMRGDFEAQRHWMEITLHTPILEWYKQTDQNDLLYWGLDYPPLTAYHSWLCGFIGDKIEPSWFALESSRGIETVGVKTFMRFTAIISELIIYIPAVIFFVSTCVGDSKIPKISLITLLLTEPGLILIDHGHFQYNSVMLGLTLWAVIFIMKDRVLLASIFFCLSFCFKQMGLYYSLAFFFYLLGRSFQAKALPRGILNVAKLGVVVSLVLLICFSPFLGSVEDISHVFRRVFPVGRGLFEDKVANFWCALSVVYKIRNHFPLETLSKLSIVATLIAAFPSGFNILFKPNPKKFLYTLVNISFAFYLFSFQVHEKSILLVVLPLLLLLEKELPMCSWLIYMATFSMYPLLKRDKLTLFYFALQILWIFQNLLRKEFKVAWWQKILFLGSFLATVVVHILDAYFVPPSHLPDLFVVLNVLVSFSAFSVGWLYFNYRQVTFLPKEKDL